MSSVYGRMPGPGHGPYSVSKFGVEAYNDALRLELAPYDVSVHILEPGFFKTPLANQDKLTKVLEDVWSRAPVEIRHEYGQKYFEKVKTAFLKPLTECFNPRTDYVVDAYFHALTSRFPWKRYVHVAHWSSGYRSASDAPDYEDPTIGNEHFMILL